MHTPQLVITDWMQRHRLTAADLDTLWWCWTQLQGFFSHRPFGELPMTQQKRRGQKRESEWLFIGRVVHMTVPRTFRLCPCKMSSTSASPTLPSNLLATCHCDRSCNLEPVDIKEPMQTPITIPWRRRCQPPFARLPAGGILGGGADPAAWAPPFSPPLQEAEGSSPSSDDDEDDCNQDDDNRDDIISVRRCLKRAPVLTILRGFDVFPSPREPQHGSVANAVAGWNRVGGVLMGFHICNDQDGFATANLTPYRGRCGNAYRNSRLALLGVHPPPTVSFRRSKTDRRASRDRWSLAPRCAAAGTNCGIGVLGNTLCRRSASGHHENDKDFRTQGFCDGWDRGNLDQFGLLPEHVLQRIIALPFKGKIAAARVWGRAVQNVGALFEMKEDAGPGHVVLDDAGCAALLQRAADLRKGRRVSWTMRERVDSSKTFGFDDGIRV
ncbi:hypothetical protein DFJ73DRAFT_880322 [Zopfochytrium polystomum]|nr:hypothetical protein DFJ73DRAFT_880322 [Zopfochytrium polystomum]